MGLDKQRGFGFNRPDSLHGFPLSCGYLSENNHGGARKRTREMARLDDEGRYKILVG